MVELTHEEHDVANIPSFVFVQRHNTNDWQLLNTNFQVLASWKLIRLDRRVHDDLGDHDEFIMIFPWKVTHHDLSLESHTSSSGLSERNLILHREKEEKSCCQTKDIWITVTDILSLFVDYCRDLTWWKEGKGKVLYKCTRCFNPSMVTKEKAWLLYHFISLPLGTPVSLPLHTKDWPEGAGELHLYLISFRG